ncbi:deoxyribose-phosphate aldolase [bacterium]|nr:deoxyribose-phosphate aldolase [bacterium]
MTKNEIENIKNLSFSDENLFKQKVDFIVSNQKYGEDIYGKIFSCLDITTLNNTDYRKALELIIKKTKTNSPTKGEIKAAGLCIYSYLVPLLEYFDLDKDIKRVVVSGGFPSGQVPLSTKISDVSFALDHKADEIDIPINRALFFENRKELKNELTLINTLIKINSNAKLKVIIETSELLTYKNVYEASMLAMECGADFIKTSTGKVSTGADIYSSFVMLSAINDYFISSQRLVGFKAAGGIRTSEQAVAYFLLAQAVMGNKFCNKETFRIGCSSLAEDIIRHIK